LPFSTQQVDLSNQMISYWANFAKDGDPNGSLAPSWPTYTSQGTLVQFKAPTAKRVSHAQIDTEHNCSLWDQVSPAL
jgi:para-nitrobenzyl esterase